MGFMFGAVVLLYVLVGLGVLKLVAMRFEGHPLANAILEVY
jgi:hypothetical protein